MIVISMVFCATLSNREFRLVKSQYFGLAHLAHGLLIGGRVEIAAPAKRVGVRNFVFWRCELHAKKAQLDGVWRDCAFVGVSFSGVFRGVSFCRNRVDYSPRVNGMEACDFSGAELHAVSFLGSAIDVPSIRWPAWPHVVIPEGEGARNLMGSVLGAVPYFETWLCVLAEAENPGVTVFDLSKVKDIDPSRLDDLAAELWGVKGIFFEKDGRFSQHYPMHVQDELGEPPALPPGALPGYQTLLGLPQFRRVEGENREDYQGEPWVTPLPVLGRKDRSQTSGPSDPIVD